MGIITSKKLIMSILTSYDQKKYKKRAILNKFKFEDIDLTYRAETHEDWESIEFKLNDKLVQIFVEWRTIDESYEIAIVTKTIKQYCKNINEIINIIKSLPEYKEHKLNQFIDKLD